MADRRHGTAHPAAGGDRCESEYPRHELPVSSRPAVEAECSDVVAGGKVIDDLDIGGEPGASKDALEQVVAEQRRVRDPAC